MIFHQPFLEAPTALVVEDNKEHFQYLQFLLKKLKVNIVGFTSWEEALKNAKHYDIDFALLDINLGDGMNGITLMRLLKQNQNLKDKKFVSITAYFTRKFHDDFIEAGFSDYIPKPYSIQDLEQVLSKPQYRA